MMEAHKHMRQTARGVERKNQAQEAQETQEYTMPEKRGSGFFR